MSFIKKVLPLSIAVGILCLDHYTKQLILDFFTSRLTPVEITSFFNILLVWNKGVSFGIFQSDNQIWLIGFSTFVSLLLIIWLLFEKKLLIKCGLAFIIAGALGNALDRMLYGAVVDFIDLFYANWHFPAFNVADISINIGVGLVLIDVLFFSHIKPKNE